MTQLGNARVAFAAMQSLICYTYSGDLWPWGTPHEASRSHRFSRQRSRVALGEPINQLEISLLIEGMCCALQDQWGY
jgi:hypothetical protein